MGEQVVGVPLAICPTMHRACRERGEQEGVDRRGGWGESPLPLVTRAGNRMPAPEWTLVSAHSDCLLMSALDAWRNLPLMYAT